MNVILNDEIIKFLQTRRLPARLTVPQVAVILGFQPCDIPVLVSKKLLRLCRYYWRQGFGKNAYIQRSEIGCDFLASFLGAPQMQSTFLLRRIQYSIAVKGRLFSIRLWRVRS